MGFVQDAWDDIRGKTAANEAKEGARLAAQGAERQQAYLEEADAPLRHYRENAMAIMANELGLPAFDGGAQQAGAPTSSPTSRPASSFKWGLPVFNGGAQQVGAPASSPTSRPAPSPTLSLVDMAKRSPLYSAIVEGGRGAGESAIARTASATGGFRGGGMIGDVAGFGKDLEAQALMQAYGDKKGFLSNLAGTPSYAPQIAQGYGNIGSILGQGHTAAANARQQGIGGLLSGGFMLGSALLGGPAGAATAGAVL